MAGTFGDPEIIDIETDILIVGGGMAACGAAIEAKSRGADNVKITLVDKAAMGQSGPVAMGGSAINTYMGGQDPADYARMVSDDQMGLSRDDLVYDIGRHVDHSLHMLEEWGLPVWKTKETEGLALADGGRPVRSGKWQIMINGEGYKPIVAEAAKKALGAENVLERVFIAKFLLDANEENRIAGAVGFSIRDHKLYVFRAKAVLDVAGDCANLFHSNHRSEGDGRTWRSVWNAGSTYALAAEVGAELTMMESRFVPAQFKDEGSPLDALLLQFKCDATNGYGEDYLSRNADRLVQYGPYDKAESLPNCLRNHAMLTEVKGGAGPIFVDTARTRANLLERMRPNDAWCLQAEAGEDFRDMCVGQAADWTGGHARHDSAKAELVLGAPSLMGSHEGCCGLWVSGPEDLAPEAWQWGYNRMTTLRGLFTAGDGVGGAGHKFSSGSYAEGRVAAQAMLRFVADNAGFSPVLAEDRTKITAKIYQPVRNHFDHREKASAPGTSSDYITPKMFQKRLQRCMDDYVAGETTHYQTNKTMLEIGLQQVMALRDESNRMRAKDLHELMRAWENNHRLWTAEAHVRHIQFRKETRYPGFYYRTDFPNLDDDKWKCFVNSRYDPQTGEWEMKKVPHIDIFEKNERVAAE